MRDIITHHYFGGDTSRLLPIIRDEGPGLLAAINAELENPIDNPAQA